MRTLDFLIIIISIALSAVACGDGTSSLGKNGTDDPNNPDNQLEIQRALSSLVAVEDCDEVLAELKAKAKAKMEETVDQNLQMMLDTLSYGDWCVYEEGVDYANDGGGTLPPSGDSGSATEYSTTNTQVAGVDEADFLKNDGTYIYIVSETDFQIIRAWPASSATTLSRTPVEGTPEKLYVHNDRAVVYSSLGSMYGNTEDYFYGDYYAPKECT